jgi:hypothetical protein
MRPFFVCKYFKKLHPTLMFVNLFPYPLEMTGGMYEAFDDFIGSESG